MTRRILGLLLLLVAAVGCTDDPVEVVVDDGDLSTAAVAEGQAESASDDSTDDSPVKSGPVTTLGPPPAVEVVDGVARFNTVLPIPSLWGVVDEDDPAFAGGGISFYRSAPDATSLAMAVGNACAQMLFDIEPILSRGPGETWLITRIASVDSSCDTDLTEQFDVGDELLIDSIDQQAIVVATGRVFIFAAIFESFSDQGDPRRDPAGALEGRSSPFFG